MRLWHYKILPVLPAKQLVSQHRECCAMRGKGWGKKHATVNYVWKYSLSELYYFHMQVIKEMEKRNYKVEQKWKTSSYRGKELGFSGPLISNKYFIYPEHDSKYLKECIDNLKGKGIIINVL